MSHSLWRSSLEQGTHANKPTVWEYDTNVVIYFETDTGLYFIASPPASGNIVWNQLMLLGGVNVLPTADPHVVGQLWANAHVVTVSAG